MTNDTKLRIELFPTEAKRLELGIDDSRSSLTYEFSSLEASHIAARILQTAKRAFELSGDPRPDIKARPTTWAVVQTSAFGLDHSQILINTSSIRGCRSGNSNRKNQTPSVWRVNFGPERRFFF